MNRTLFYKISHAILIGLLILSFESFAKSNTTQSENNFLVIKTIERYLTTDAYSSGPKYFPKMEFINNYLWKHFEIKSMGFYNNVTRYHRLDSVLTLGLMKQIVKVQTVFVIKFATPTAKEAFLHHLNSHNSSFDFKFKFGSNNPLRVERFNLIATPHIYNKSKKTKILPTFQVRGIEDFEHIFNHDTDFTIKGNVSIKLSEVRPYEEELKRLPRNETFEHCQNKIHDTKEKLVKETLTGAYYTLFE